MLKLSFSVICGPLFVFLFFFFWHCIVCPLQLLRGRRGRDCMVDLQLLRGRRGRDCMVDLQL